MATGKSWGWTESVKILAGVAHKNPQYAYVGLQKSLQKEWSFVQRVTLGVGYAFSPVEEALREIFVTALYEGLGEGVSKREITRLSVKQVVLSLSDPTQTAPENWTADHSACLQEGLTSVRRRGQSWAEEVLTAALEGAPVLHACRMRRTAKTGAWLTVLPSTVNGTKLEAQEWSDALFLRYGMDPPDLHKYCDG